MVAGLFLSALTDVEPDEVLTESSVELNILFVEEQEDQVET